MPKPEIRTNQGSLAKNLPQQKYWIDTTALFLATSSEASKLVASLHGKLRAHLASPQEELEGLVNKMITTTTSSSMSADASDGPKQKGKQSKLKYYMYYRF